MTTMRRPASNLSEKARRAFTLLELMVSISIIAVLIGILMPALKMVRNTARTTICLSNQKQIAIGWATYLVEHEYFPSSPPFDEDGDGVIAPEEQGEILMQFDWGGVDWFSNDYAQTGYASFRFTAQRPLNSYVGSETRERARAELFKCPNDNFVEWWGADTSPYFAQFAGDPFGTEVAASRSEEAGETIFATLGTSYRANEWIWAKVGSKVGFDAWSEGHSGMTRRNRPEFAEDPSTFTLTGDLGTYLVGRYPYEHNARLGKISGEWHGRDRCNMAFLDGSARTIHMQPGGYGPGYSFWFERRLHIPSILYASEFPSSLWYPPEFAPD